MAIALITGASVENVTSIAIDSVNGKIYWISQNAGSWELWWADLDGGNKAQLTDTKFDAGRHVCVDPVNSKIYVINYIGGTAGVDRHIIQAELDGTGAVSVLDGVPEFAEFIEFPQGIEVDPAADRLLWFDVHIGLSINRLFRMNLNGAGPPTLENEILSFPDTVVRSFTLRPTGFRAYFAGSENPSPPSGAWFPGITWVDFTIDWGGAPQPTAADHHVNSYLGVRGLGYDPTNDLILMTTNDGDVRTMNPDGTGLTVIDTTPLGGGIGYDAVNGRPVWGDSIDNAIYTLGVPPVPAIIVTPTLAGPLTKRTDQIERAKSDLISEFQNKTSIDGLTEAWVDQLSGHTGSILGLEDTHIELQDDRRLGDAVGAQLDGLGDIVGRERAGADDAEFEMRVRVQILINLAEGTTEELITIARALAGAEAIVEIEQQFPAAVVIRIRTDATGLDAQLIFDLACSIVAAGVRCTLELFLGIPFEFAGGTEGLGFGDTAVPATGGGFASVISG